MKLTRHITVIPALLIAFRLSLYPGVETFDRVPRLEDEMAELFQARVFASGRLFVPTPPAADAFHVPFVVDVAGRRFSKYPPGHAALLATGVWLGDPWIINPLLGTVGLALSYALVKRFAGPGPALWAVWLGALSPFYVMTVGAAMQHPASLVFGALFILGLLRRGTARPALDWGTGLALGLTALVRPYTAALLALPAFAFLLLSGRWRRPDAGGRAIRATLAAMATAGLLPLYNFALTGELRLSLYTLYWPYDRPGFGATVGPQGFTLAKALDDTARSLMQLAHDLHGWPFLSLILPLVGLVVHARRRETWLLAAFPAVLVAGYLLYFHNSRLYGPRYYSEALPALLGLSALGACWLWSRLRPRPVRLALATALLTLNLALYLPFRLNLLRTLYDGALLDQPVAELSARVNRPALIFIFADNWPGAASYTLANPLDLDAPILFARYLGPEAYLQARTAYPGHAAYFYRDGDLTPATDPPSDWTPRYPTVAPPG